MKNNKKICISKDDSHLYTEEEVDPIFYQDIMTQTINKKLDIILSNEISKKKEIIYDLYKNSFGQNVVEKKSKSLNRFELLFGKYLFSPRSNFLQKNFPRLHNKFFREKKIDLEKLKSKINIGQMMYFNLRKYLVSNKSLINDKLFYISKNFSTNNDKDVVSNLYFKFKKNALKRKHKGYKGYKSTTTSNCYSSSKSLLNFGDLSRVNSNKSELKLKIIDEKELDFKNSININTDEQKEGKKIVFNDARLENGKKPKIFIDNHDNFSKTQNNFYHNIRNKNLIKYKTLNKKGNKNLIKYKTLNKKGNKNLIKYKTLNKKNKNDNSINNENSINTSPKFLNRYDSSEINDNKYKKFYLSNPYYMYNSNIFKRNKNKYKEKTPKSEIVKMKNDNSNSKIIFKAKNSGNIFSPFSTLSTFKNKDSSSLFDSNSNIIVVSPKNKTISSFNNIKTINNNTTNKTINNIEEKEKDDLSKDITNIDNAELAKIKNIKKNICTLSEKNSFDKYLKKKTKNFKNRINSEVKVLNNCTNKCNKKLIKLIDKNFILNSKQKQSNKNKNDNFDITKLLLDDKIPKKVFIKYAKNQKTIKPVFKKTVDDLTKFGKINKELGQQSFIKNINNFNTELALYFIGKLFPTKHIKFRLKEYERKREELKTIKDMAKLKKLRAKSKNNLFKIKQLEYVLLNKKDEFFKNENEKKKNLKIFKEIHKINNKKDNNNSYP